MRTRYPSRIVCLTEETTETLYLLGEGDRVVGISGYTVRPPEARHKPKVSAFINARFDKIEALEPDLILAFSDLQADIAAELIRRGYSVVTFNQRSIAEILQMIRMVGAIVGCADRAVALADSLEHGLERIRTKAAVFGRRPRVFFEEWDAPLISGICWVDELVEIAGGEPLFPALRKESLAKNRIVSPDEVAARDPEVIIASWCGKAMKKRTIVERPGWDRVSAVRADHIYEIKSTYILQPGPAALTEGVTRLHECIARAAQAGRVADAFSGWVRDDLERPGLPLRAVERMTASAECCRSRRRLTCVRTTAGIGSVSRRRSNVGDESAAPSLSRSGSIFRIVNHVRSRSGRFASSRHGTEIEAHPTRSRFLTDLQDRRVSSDSARREREASAVTYREM